MAEKKNGAADKGQETISKMEAVRRALDKMGPEAKPSEMQPYIKCEFGIEMTTDHISTYKGDILKKKRKKAAGKTPQAPKALPPVSALAPQASILLEDVLTVKALLDRVGAESLRFLIDGLAKEPGRA